MTEEEVKNMSGSKKFVVNLGSGLTAGVAAAVLSQVRLLPIFFEGRSSEATLDLCFGYAACRHLIVSNKSRTRSHWNNDASSGRPC